ncbi:stage III sporulation protein AF [Flavonifractor sp. An306]|uniref:stage III sporulation protein AF n=1 Tax=Flavonifractor sp. An306 TaxID=1965629 RepID=UPI000B367D31|nr:stage III sporulation protein AF [Flavonifractor sp. An306]OUO40015.1 stage III sporulation protein AF [Flavonifractor sp. An306]
MLDIIRQWLLGITCVALVAALAESLTPPGAVRKVGRLTGGLVLLIAMLHPLMALDQDALTRALTEYRLELSTYSDELEEENRSLMKGIIEERSNAYIQDKAEEMGIQCQISVEVGEEGDWPVPESVTVFGSLSEEQQAELTQAIEVDFAIPAERQSYQSGGTS